MSCLEIYQTDPTKYDGFDIETTYVAFRGNFLNDLKRNVESLRQYSFNEDWYPASYAIRCKCKVCHKTSEFVFWREHKEFPTYTGSFFSTCLSNEDKQETSMDLESLVEFLENISTLMVPIQDKLREPYYFPSGTRVSMADSYYW